MTGTAGGFSFDRSLPPQTGFAAYPRDEAVLTRARSAWAPQFNDLHKFFEAQYDGVDAARVPGIAGYRPPTPGRTQRRVSCGGP